MTDGAVFTLRLRMGKMTALAGSTWPAGTTAGDGLDKVLDALCAAGAEGTVLWWEEALASRLTPPQGWPALLRHDRELLHLGLCLTPASILRGLQLAAGESPFVLPALGPRRRLSWLISAGAGVTTCAALRRGGGLPAAYDRPAATLTAFAIPAFRSGLFAYHEPRLAAADATFGAADLDAWHGADLRRLVAHTFERRRRWSFALGRRLPLPDRRLVPAAVDQLASREDRRETSTAATKTAKTEVGSSEVAIDVIIATLGRPQPLLDLLDDLAAQQLPPRQIIVIEQTPPGVATLPPDLTARSAPYQLRHLKTATVGASRARNLGLRESRAPVIALLDDDIRLDPDFLASMVEERQTFGVEGVNARVLAPGEQAPITHLPPRPCAGLGAGRALVGRRALFAVGGFDETIEGWGEDYELGFRLNLRGFPLLESDRCRLIHIKAPSGGFRTTERPPPPWADAWPAPMPSPLITYRWLRWLSPAMGRGAACQQLVGALREHPAFPFSALLLPWRWLRWRRSLRYARQLLQHGPRYLTSEP